MPLTDRGRVLAAHPDAALVSRPEPGGSRLSGRTRYHVAAGGLDLSGPQNSPAVAWKVAAARLANPHRCGLNPAHYPKRRHPVSTPDESPAGAPGQTAEALCEVCAEPLRPNDHVTLFSHQTSPPARLLMMCIGCFAAGVGLAARTAHEARRKPGR